MSPPRTKESPCRDFIKRLREGGNSIDLSNPEKWAQAAIIASGGAGNPSGSKVAINDLAREETEHVFDRLIWRFAHEPVTGQSTFGRLFFEACRLMVATMTPSLRNGQDLVEKSRETSVTVP